MEVCEAEVRLIPGLKLFRFQEYRPLALPGLESLQLCNVD